MAHVSVLLVVLICLQPGRPNRCNVNKYGIVYGNSEMAYRRLTSITTYQHFNINRVYTTFVFFTFESHFQQVIVATVTKLVDMSEWKVKIA